MLLENSRKIVLKLGSSTVVDSKGAFKKNAGFVERNIIEGPTRFLSAEDEFFKQLNYRAAVYGQAVAEGIRKYHTKELDKFLEELHKDYHYIDKKRRNLSDL